MVEPGRETIEEATWAVVTGASSGIGAAIAQELAGRGWSIVLVGRNAAQLEEQANLVRAKGVQAWVVTADLSTPEGIARVAAVPGERSIAVGALVNNAGFGIHGAFVESSPADEARMVDLQIKASLELAKAFLPGMLQRRRGYILTVGSVYAFSPVPNQAVYAASKAFLLSWTRSMALELHGSGVSVTLLCPGITLTNFRASAGMKEKKSAFSMTAEAVATIGVRAMLRGKTVSVPGWHNTIYTTMARVLPAGFLGTFTRWFNKRRGIAGHGKDAEMRRRGDAEKQK